MSAMKDLRRELGLPDGYTLSAEGKKSCHLQVYRPDGKVLRSVEGLPIVVSLTPSDWRGRKNEKARIRKALEGR